MRASRLNDFNQLDFCVAEPGHSTPWIWPLIKTYDGQRVVIPELRHLHAGRYRANRLLQSGAPSTTVGIGYSDDIKAACRVIVEAIGRVEGVEKNPAPEAFAWALDASSINVKVRWWSDSHRANVVQVQGRAIAAIKRRAV